MGHHYTWREEILEREINEKLERVRKEKSA